MTTWVAFLRAVNLGGATTLRMADLRAACLDAGFRDPRTVGTSGNVAFAAEGPEDAVRAALEARLRTEGGRAVEAVLRSAAEVAALAEGDPFPGADLARVVAILLHAPAPPGAIADARGLRDEALVVGPRAVWVHYPSGQGRSRLRLGGGAEGTARNLATLRRVAAVAG